MTRIPGPTQNVTEYVMSIFLSHFLQNIVCCIWHVAHVRRHMNELKLNF